VHAALQALGPDALWTGLGSGAPDGTPGGYGVAAAFHGLEAASGPTVLVRAELDALPIQEDSAAAHASQTPGVAHLCGHDGHMTILLGLARRLAEGRPKRGRIILLFQPAEETGQGALAVARDPRFAELRPDFAFALHNLPGAPLGEVIIREGTFNCASRGLAVDLRGSTSHAAHPEDGRSPAEAMCELSLGLAKLHEHPSLITPHAANPPAGLLLSTLIHARLGGATFGTSPGEAVVMATLRAEHDDDMRRLSELALAEAARIAEAHGLRMESTWHDEFRACVNASQPTEWIREAATEAGFSVRTLETPFRWSEDFGALRDSGAEVAMFGLGAGLHHPQLHAPNYDFPDELLGPGVEMFASVCAKALEGGPNQTRRRTHDRFPR